MRSQILILYSTHLVIRCHGCSAMQRPSTNPCQHLILLRLRMWVHICDESDLMRRQILIPYSNPQLTIRCSACSAMQEPSINHYYHSTLLRLQTWVYLCAESDLMRNLILIPILTIRCYGCSKVQRPSIRTFVILETIGHTHVYISCFSTLDAVTQITRQVHLDRGALLQLVLRTWY